MVAADERRHAYMGLARYASAAPSNVLASSHATLQKASSSLRAETCSGVYRRERKGCQRALSGALPDARCRSVRQVVEDCQAAAQRSGDGTRRRPASGEPVNHSYGGHMAEKSITAILSGYFNQGDGKRGLVQWRDELSALSDEEKRDLAEGVCAITGDTIKA
jgi:hypothetical protein